MRSRGRAKLCAMSLLAGHLLLLKWTPLKRAWGVPGSGAAIVRLKLAILAILARIHLIATFVFLQWLNRAPRRRRTRINSRQVEANCYESGEFITCT